MENNDLPSHTNLEIMAQFGETALFKQFFADWRDLDETDGLGEEHIYGQGIAKVEHEEFDASTMHDNPDKAAEFGMPDDGSGEKKIYRIVESEREELDEDKWGIFYSTECYIISYTYETPKESVTDISIVRSDFGCLGSNSYIGLVARKFSILSTVPTRLLPFLEEKRA